MFCLLVFITRWSQTDEAKQANVPAFFPHNGLGAGHPARKFPNRFYAMFFELLRCLLIPKNCIFTEIQHIVRDFDRESCIMHSKYFRVESDGSGKGS